MSPAQSKQAKQSTRRASSSTARRSRKTAGGPDLVADARRVASDASSMVRHARRVGADLREIITDRPLQAIGTAAGAGFVVAGGLSPGIVRSLAGLASRLAMIVITRRLVSVLDGADKPSTSRGSAAKKN